MRRRGVCRALALRFEVRALLAQEPVAKITRGIEEIPEPLVRDAIADEKPLATGDDEPLAAQRGEVLRNRGLAEVEHLLELDDGFFTLAKGIEKADPRGMRERFKEIRLEVPKHI